MSENAQKPTTETLLRERLAEVEASIKADLDQRHMLQAEAKKITDGLPAQRAECNRLKRALGLPCREKKAGGEEAESGDA